MSDLSAPAALPFERARDLPLLEQVGRDLAAVEAALTRLDRDTYGVCGVCGEPIDDRRLAEMPATDDCGGHGAWVSAE